MRFQTSATVQPDAVAVSVRWTEKYRDLYSVKGNPNGRNSVARKLLGKDVPPHFSLGLWEEGGKMVNSRFRANQHLLSSEALASTRPYHTTWLPHNNKHRGADIEQCPDITRSLRLLASSAPIAFDHTLNVSAEWRRGMRLAQAGSKHTTTPSITTHRYVIRSLHAVSYARGSRGTLPRRRRSENHICEVHRIHPIGDIR